MWGAKPAWLIALVALAGIAGPAWAQDDIGEGNIPRVIPRNPVNIDEAASAEARATAERFQNTCARNPGLCRNTIRNICAQSPALCDPNLTQCPQHSRLPVTFQQQMPTPSTNKIAYQEFPANGQTETAWFVTFDTAQSEGLYITNAYFKRGPNKKWIKVLGRTEVSEIFVPYATGRPRFFDLKAVTDVESAVAGDAGACGKVTGARDRVVREIRDTGMLWKNDRKGRRGQKLVLWSTLDASNYNYIMSYAFHDNGKIELRGGATAVNYPSKRFVAHLHTFLWRINVDLAGAKNDTVHVMRHKPRVNRSSWQDDVTPLNGGEEGGLAWNPKQFTRLRVSSKNLTNNQNRRTTYDLRPLYRGVARTSHPNNKPAFTRKDIWATQFDPMDDWAPNLAQEQGDGQTHTASYVDGESIEASDVVLWQSTPVLHIPRQEDGCCRNAQWNGVAHTMWGGTDLRPRNLFDGTPLYP